MKKLDIFLGISLIIIGVKYLFGLSTYTDIMLYDESNYLYNGVYLLNEGFPDVLNAPLYAVWYFLLSLFQPDLTSLYFLNYTIIAILLPLTLFIALRAQGVSSVASFTFSFFILLSAGNLIVPLVGQFALIIILISLIFYKDDLLPLQIGTLCATLVRPEFILSFILLLLLKRKNSYMFLSLPPLLLLFFVSDDRSFFAFSQHFSLNWVNWNGSELSPWTNYQEIMTQNFGSSESVMGAFFYNPLLFLTHTFENILSIGKESLEVLRHASIFSGGEVLAFIGVIGFASARLKFNKVLSLTILLLPSLISLIIIYPRKHYLFMMLVLLFFLILISVKKQTNEKIHHWVIIIPILILITPSVSKLLGHTQPNLTTINYLKSLQIHTEVNLLEADGGYNIYLGRNFKRIAEYDKDCGFNEFLEKNHINMIVLSSKLMNYNAFREDPQWRDFLNNTKDFKKIPNTNRYIIDRH